ncbi:MAG: serine/threonine-protein kinase [Deltaproteobacteria bacterium]
MLAIGSLIGGRFRIDQILGAGGMGIVVAATHTELGHRVAIKVLRDEMAQSPAIVERFLREARSVVGLRTEHVCRVTDIGRLDTGAPFIVMEMLDGVDLQHVVQNQPLPVTTAVEYVLQACVALAEAHAAGIIHRDLKPANLFVTRRLDGGPLVKVLDFGIAKALAETGAHLTHQSAMGSPGYMSPEQIQSARDVDVRTDLWALGVTLYQLLSARMPFPASSHTEIAIKVATEPPAPLDVDPALHAVIWKCLEKKPADRYSTIGELVTALAPFGGPSARTHVGLANALGGTGAAASPTSAAPFTAGTAGAATQMTQMTQTTDGQAVVVAPETAEPPRRRAWPLLVVSTLLALVIGGAIAAMVWFRRPAPGGVPVADARAIVGHPDVPDVGVDVGSDVRVDTAVVIDAGDPWKTDDAPSIPLADAHVAPPQPATPVFHPPTKQQILMMQQCAAIMTGKKVGIRQLAKCVCGSNPASGTAYLSTLKGDDLVQASEECKKLGIVPP